MVSCEHTAKNESINPNLWVSCQNRGTNGCNSNQPPNQGLGLMHLVDRNDKQRHPYRRVDNSGMAEMPDHESSTRVDQPRQPCRYTI